MSNQEHVAIFWDYENCRPPAHLAGYTVADKIRRVAQTFGNITFFKAYLDVPLDNTKSGVLHSELQSSGVSLTHCPHNGKKDVADKMMLVDMLAYAIDKPAPATIILISGDRDFAYGIATLKLRGYTVVVIVPASSAHSSLKAQATWMLNWQDVMTLSDDGSVSTSTGTSRKRSGSGGAPTCTSTTNIHPPVQPAASTSVLASSSSPTKWRPRPEVTTYTPMRPDENQVNISWTNSTTRDGAEQPAARPPFTRSNGSSNTLVAGQDPEDQARDTLHGQTDPKGKGSSSAPLPSSTLTHGNVAAQAAAASYFSGLPESDSATSWARQPAKPIKTDSSASTSHTLAHNDPQQPLLSPLVFKSSPPPSGTSPSYEIDLEAQRCETPYSFIQPSTVPMESDNEIILVQSESATLHAEVERQHSQESTDYDEAADQSPSNARRTVSMPSIISPTPTTALNASFTESLHRAWTMDSVGWSATEPPVTANYVLAPLAFGSIPSQGILSLGQDAFPPGAFESLVKVLQRFRNQGIIRPRWSQVGSELMQLDPQAYVRAGVMQLKKYIELAESARIVVIGGLENMGREWVELNPVFGPLVTLLERDSHRRVLRSLLGSQIPKEFPKAYKRAGVSGLTGYLALAEQAGIVTLGSGSIPGREWVTLRKA